MKLKPKNVTHRQWLITSLKSILGRPVKIAPDDYLHSPKECAYVMGQIRRKREPLGLDVIELGIRAGILIRFKARHKIWEVSCAGKDCKVADDVAFASKEMAVWYCMGMALCANKSETMVV